MSTSTTYSKEDLVRLKESLPFGGIQSIAKTTGYHRNYVASVLGGEQTVNPDNEKIIFAATSIIRKLRENGNKLKQFLNQPEQNA